MNQAEVDAAAAARAQSHLDVMSISARDLEQQIDTVNRLPERIFKESFLAFFCGELPPNPKDDHAAVWISVAGAATSEVEIIDEVGKPLFRVPALIDTSGINPVVAERGVAIAAIAALASEHARSLPSTGRAFLMRNLELKSREIQKISTDFSANELRWIEIFKRYGKWKDVAAEKAEEVKQEESRIQDDELNFD